MRLFLTFFFIVAACDAPSRPDAVLPASLTNSAPLPDTPPAPELRADPPSPEAPRPHPACPETIGISEVWPRPDGLARVVPAKPGAVGHMEQDFAGRSVRLRFVGTHLFDLLDKLLYEGGPTELDRRRVACIALDAVARSGAPVVRLWGSLKQTGSPTEIEHAADMLALLLDENARRERPLRFIVTLQNHQAGYGAPDSTRSLDDQDPKSPFFARRFYLEGGWKEKGASTLAERIEAFAARPAIARDPAILAFELVNELDTFRNVARGTWDGPEASAWVNEFVHPALRLLGERFPHPILLGDLRGHEASYVSFQRAWIEALPASLRARIVWTAHVYTTVAPSNEDPAFARATWKLDHDLTIARSLGLPFLLGELGQHVPKSAPRFCGGGAKHDLGQLFDVVLGPARPRAERRPIEAAILWGEGLCNLDVEGGRTISIGAGGDSADIGPDEPWARERIREIRQDPRFRVE
ncbi:hypothetical protein [Polyangium sp. 15x6]|uniref:hypothetical protein n=1 Tax=Polyangium sp. 15x6 TaxID=3042687 RepID=UPI00249B57AF|nr:hypothetical protein [Polyangium sp. 15x6]MDI3285725.1 hypothetical protein [Polyangium sp. 15x6]